MSVYCTTSFSVCSRRRTKMPIIYPDLRLDYKVATHPYFCLVANNVGDSVALNLAFNISAPSLFVKLGLIHCIGAIYKPTLKHKKVAIGFPAGAQPRTALGRSFLNSARHLPQRRYRVWATTETSQHTSEAPLRHSGAPETLARVRWS